MITHAIATFKTGDYDVTRPGAGSRVAGVWTEGSPSVTTGVAMSIQPVKGPDLKVLPVGSHTEDYRLVLTTFDLLRRDQVTYKGAQWTVYTAEDWTMRGVTWTRAYITRSVVTP